MSRAQRGGGAVAPLRRGAAARARLPVVLASRVALWAGVALAAAPQALAQNPPRGLSHSQGLSQTHSQVQQQDAAAQQNYRLMPRELAPGVFVVEGANDDFTPANGCNIINTGFIVTRDGVVVVNTGPSRLYGEQLRRAIARVTPAPVLKVIHLNLHPDYFLGNQGFADLPRAATAATAAGMAREAKAYEDNLYRLCGDWMKGTQAVLPSEALQPGLLTLGGREFELREFQGHTDSDLVLIDKASGVAFVGGLAFADRIPTTPHARIPAWLASLQALEALNFRVLVPSHGPVRADKSAIAQTRAYLQWLDRHFSDAAGAGWEMVDLLRAPVPEVYRRWAAFRTEYIRNVAHLYPGYERAALAAQRP